MIISKTAKVKVVSNTLKYYLDKGYNIPMRKASPSYFKRYKKEYVYDLPYTLEIKISDIQKKSGVKIRVKCDICGNEKDIGYDDYQKGIAKGGYYACKNCVNKKTRETLVSKYGESVPMRIEQFKDKQQKTLFNNWGAYNPQKNKDIQEKTKQTNREKYGCDYAINNNDVRQKAIETNIKNWGTENVFGSEAIKDKIRQSMISKYGVPNPMLYPDFKEKFAVSISNNQSFRTSSQQIYLCNLYVGTINAPISYYNVDILLQDNLVVEYDGGGHWLNITHGTLSEEEFNQREIVRSSVIKREGYKIMRIISHTDKLPSDEILLQMLSETKQYFSDYPNHSWREWYIDEGIYKDAEHKDGEPYDYGTLRKIRKSDVESVA